MDKAKGNKFALNPFARGFRNNFKLLTSDPLHLRHLDFEIGPSPLANLESRLIVFWSNANDFLREMRGAAVDLWPISEKDLVFYAQPEQNAKLTEAQKNALQVFRCIRRIQKCIYPNEPVYQEDGPINYYPIGIKEDNDDSESEFEITEGALESQMRLLIAGVALEMMHLTLAVIKCDFHDFIWPDAQRGAAVLFGSRSKRDDNLNKAIIEKLRSGGLQQSALEILAALEKDIPEYINDDDDNCIVYHIFADDSSIGWYDERKKARETTFKSFQNRLSKIKKRLKNT